MLCKCDADELTGQLPETVEARRDRTIAFGERDCRTGWQRELLLLEAGISDSHLRWFRVHGETKSYRLG
jgi:hypothetical protein